jgi:hypothetical protein
MGADALPRGSPICLSARSQLGKSDSTLAVCRRLAGKSQERSWSSLVECCFSMCWPPGVAYLAFAIRSIRREETLKIMERNQTAVQLSEIIAPVRMVYFCALRCRCTALTHTLTGQKHSKSGYGQADCQTPVRTECSEYRLSTLKVGMHQPPISVNGPFSILTYLRKTDH